MVVEFVVVVLLLHPTLGEGKIVEQNIYDGSWVEESTYPLYDAKDCPFIEGMFDCKKNGRPDSDYTKYRWKPTLCPLPRFDGVKFLKNIKGKKIIFVGDSISLNQFQSLTCLLHVAVPRSTYTSTREGALSTFTFPEYNVTIDMLRQAFLVDIKVEPRGRVLYLDSLTTSEIWGKMNVLIFDTWHWWNNRGPKQPWEWVVYGNTTVPDIDRMFAYEYALNTWAKWIDANVDPKTTRIFFQSISPDHAGCINITKPLSGREGIRPHRGQPVLEKVLNSMAKPVNLLNITTMSDLRFDAHPGMYGLVSQDSKDCTHWCLSGIPDIWNELLQYVLSN